MTNFLSPCVASNAKKLHVFQDVEVEEEPKDERSVDDLLSFINGPDGDIKGTRSNKNKKKNRRRKDTAKDPSFRSANENHSKEFNPLPSAYHNANFEDALEASGVQDHIAVNFSSKIEFNESDFDDDDFDPAMKEELDREVEDFARRLNSDWPARIQILPSHQNRRLTPISMNSNGSTNRCTSFGRR